MIACLLLGAGCAGCDEGAEVGGVLPELSEAEPVVQVLGTVVQGSGAPVAGASVSIFFLRDVEGEAQRIGPCRGVDPEPDELVSDSEGRFAATMRFARRTLSACVVAVVAAPAGMVGRSDTLSQEISVPRGETARVLFAATIR